MSEGDITSRYSLEKMKQLLSVALGQINALSNKLKQDIEEKTLSLVSYEEVMKELESAISQAGQTSIAQLLAISGAAVREAIDNAMAAQGTANFESAVKTMCEQFANLRNAFESFEKAYEQATKAVDADSPLYLAYHSSNKKSLDDAAKYVHEALQNSSWKRLASGGFDSSRDNLSSLRGFVSTIATGKLFTGENTGGINPATVIGFLAEGVYGNALKEILSGISFGNGKYGFKVQATGDISGYTTSAKGESVGFKAMTSDISVSLTDKTGSLTMTLPGISLKRTGAYTRLADNNLTADIHVKSSNLGNMLATAGIGLQERQHIYNIIANNGRAAKIVTKNDGSIGETYLHPFLDLNFMYRWIYHSTLLASFAGNLTTSDFANYWVVNDKVYTASEIVISAMTGSMPVGHAGRHVFQLYLDDASRSGIAKAAAEIPAKHSAIFDRLLGTDASMEEQGIMRSDEVSNLITHIPFSLHFRVSINLLLGY